MSLGGGPRPGGRPRPAPGGRLTVALGGLRPPTESSEVKSCIGEGSRAIVFQRKFILEFDRSRRSGLTQNTAVRYTFVQLLNAQKEYLFGN